MLLEASKNVSRCYYDVFSAVMFDLFPDVLADRVGGVFADAGFGQRVFQIAD